MVLKVISAAGQIFIESIKFADAATTGLNLKSRYPVLVCIGRRWYYLAMAIFESLAMTVVLKIIYVKVSI